jgi:hypothetical protein
LAYTTNTFSGGFNGQGQHKDYEIRKKKPLFSAHLDDLPHAPAAPDFFSGVPVCPHD